jgi:hypothetical protein
MLRARYILIPGFLVSGCLIGNPDGAGGTSTTGSNSSGSVTGGTLGDSETAGSPTTTTYPSGTSDATASSGEACNFLCDDPASPCDVFGQDCPEGQKCAPYAEDLAYDQVKCVPANGTDLPGGACTADDPATGVDSCIEGAICLDVDMEGVGICVALCTGSIFDPLCEPSFYCDGHGEAFNLCMKADCDPLLQDCMFKDQACYPDSFGFGCYYENFWPTDGQANAPCEDFNACDEGLTCLEAAQVGKGCEAGPIGCCTPFCQFPDGACPKPDQQCMQWFDPLQLPANDPQLAIGYCGVPS